MEQVRIILNVFLFAFKFLIYFTFRQVLCMWRENALALRCEAKATTCAEEHYRRAILAKVGSVQQIPRSKYQCEFREGSGNAIQRTKIFA